MIAFNIDFLTKQLKNQTNIKAIKGYHDENVQNMVGLVNMINKKSIQHHLAIALIRISVSKRKKVQKMLFVERTISRLLFDSLNKIKRFSVLNNSKQINKQNKLKYPLTIMNRVVGSNKLSKLQAGWSRLIKNKQRMDLVGARFVRVQQICYQYQKRLFVRQLFVIYNRIIIKQRQYSKYASNLAKTVQKIKTQKLFTTFLNITLKASMKVVSQFQKNKTSKRDESVKSTVKRTEIVNELKRKITNLIGQVHEENMRNNKKRTDGSKQNGQRLMKKNEQLRGYQIQLTQVSNDIERMEKEIERKIQFINSRPKNAISFEQLRSLYTTISQNSGNTISVAQIQAKINKKHTNEFENTPNYIKSQNSKLKYLINLYEQLQGSRKSDIYINIDNENLCLKGLISSFIRMEYFEPKREQIIQSMDEINSNMQQFRRQMNQLNEQKQQITKK